MPKMSLAAPMPPSSSPALLPLRVLGKTVTSRGLCTRAHIDEINDPWFPATRDPERLYEAARKACAGCPVIEECREMTFRIESRLPEVAITGIFGGLTPDERIGFIRANRTTRAL